MVGEEAAKKLYHAASKGDVTAVQQLLQQDPDLLDGVSLACSNRTPLHVATMEGNRDVVEEMLKRNPQLAWELDSQKSSPLHIAAAKGYVEIASLLLSQAPKACWWRDCHGMNPIHIAAMNGHVGILEELIKLDPSPAREKVDCRQTVLHLCVKHGQLTALEVLVRKFRELVGAEDDDGYTILHLAAVHKHQEMIKYLVERCGMNMDSVNSKGLTARRIMGEWMWKSPLMLISEIIRVPEAKVRETREVVMVVMVLIATMAFQAVVSPPGGVWQDDSPTHKAGEAVMASTHPKIYKSFIRANTVAFVSSLVVIFMVTVGVSTMNNMFTVAAISYAIWVTLASVAVSYGAAAMVITPNTETQSLAHVINIVVAVSVSFFVMLRVQGFWRRGWMRLLILLETCWFYFIRDCT